MVRIVAWRAGNDAGHGLIAVADENFFAATHHPDVGAEAGFQVADVNAAHD